MATDYNYHFLILASGLSGAWFIQAARQYYLRYEPIVTDDWELVSRVPSDARAVVTLLARPEDVDTAKQLMAEQRADIDFDLTVADDLPTMEVLLNKRVQSGFPLGQRSN